MSRIIGYTKQKKPKWPFIVPVLVVLLVAIIVFIISLAKEPAEQIKIVPATSSTTSTTITLMPIPNTIPTPPTTMIKAAAKEDIWSQLGNKFKKKDKAEKKIEVVEIIFTNGVDDYNLPVDGFIEISREKVARVYCYTNIKSANIPDVIRHIWLAPDGAQIADIHLDIINSSAHTWSYVNLSGAPAGEWKVVVKAADGDVIGEKTFLLYQ